MDGYEAVSGRGGDWRCRLEAMGSAWGAAESGSDGSARRGVGGADRAAGTRWRVCVRQLAIGLGVRSDGGDQGCPSVGSASRAAYARTIDF